MTELISLTLRLTQDERNDLANILDVLIPAAAGLPAAADVEVHTRWIDEALRLRPDLRPALDAAVAAVAGKPAPYEDAVRAFAEAEPDSFAGLGTLIAGGYYMDARVREALGYPGQEDRPLTDETDSYMDMLERVVERGQVYRPTP